MNGLRNKEKMRLIDSIIYKLDLEKAIENADLSQLNGKSVCITCDLMMIRILV